ncbi:hypothetical protein [Celeribacter ethanolicus]|uniref:hypothetical protein n=1 Tax=Celeribacter ethanolicus TaxID=1758178 RepID=UPI0012FD1BC9|nr:hypothetical protein [Celeribacter ethanolicus]
MRRVRTALRERLIRLCATRRGVSLSSCLVLDLLPLRNAHGPVTSRPMADGMQFHIDPKGQVEGEWFSEAGQRFHFTARVIAPVDWVALHIGLPRFEKMSELSHLAVILRAASAVSLRLELAIRSYTAEGFQDSFLFPELHLTPGGVDHCATLALAQAPDFPRQADQRELVIFCPTEGEMEIAFDTLKVLSL